MQKLVPDIEVVVDGVKQNISKLVYAKVSYTLDKFRSCDFFLLILSTIVSLCDMFTNCDLHLLNYMN